MNPKVDEANIQKKKIKEPNLSDGGGFFRSIAVLIRKKMLAIKKSIRAVGEVETRPLTYIHVLKLYFYTAMLCMITTISPDSIVTWLLGGRREP